MTLTHRYRYCTADDPPPDLPAVSAILRLGKKYDIRRLYDEAVGRLKNLCPTDFITFILHWTPLRPPIQLYHGVWFDVVNLIMEMGFVAFLPVALTRCATTHTLEEILEGIKIGGATITLSSEDQKWCLVGRERLRKTVWHDFRPNCISRAACRVEGLKIAEECEWRIRPVTNIENWDYRWDERLCSVCRVQAKNLWDERRENAWTALPSYYSLPSWQQLDNS
jgi:hypothetical protein